MIYLDNNASTPVDPEVSDAIFSCLKRDFGNPSSVHTQGRRAKEVIETSRKYVSDLLECSQKEIFFTSGGTESNNLALLGDGKASSDRSYYNFFNRAPISFQYSHGTWNPEVLRSPMSTLTALVQLSPKKSVKQSGKIPYLYQSCTPIMKQAFYNLLKI